MTFTPCLFIVGAGRARRLTFNLTATVSWRVALRRFSSYSDADWRLMLEPLYTQAPRENN